MKKTTLLIILLTVSFGYAQQQQYLFDFAPGDPDGIAANWITFDNTPPPSEIIDNPDPGEVNPNVNKVLKVVVGPGNAFYAGVNNIFQDAAFGTWRIDASVPSNLTVSMDVNKNYVGTVGIKMANITGGTAFQITDQNVGNTVVDQWQTLTWTLPSIPPGLETNLAQFVIFVDWTEGQPDRAPNSTILIDNIRFNAEKLTDPATPAADPTTAPEEFGSTGTDIYVYSGLSGNANQSSYPTFNLVSFNGTVAITTPEFSGNQVIKLQNLDFYGQALSEPISNFDITGTYNFVHLNYYATTSTAINFSLVDDSLSQTVCCGNPAEPFFKIGGGDATLITGEWVSLFIPLSHFNNLNSGWDGTDIKQTLFTGNGTFYIDNIFFSTTSTLGTEEFEISDFSVYPNPSQNNWTIKSNRLVSSVQLFDVLGKQVLSLNPDSPLVNIDASSLSKGMYFANINTNGTNNTIKLIKN